MYLFADPSKLKIKSYLHPKKGLKKKMRRQFANNTFPKFVFQDLVQVQN